MRGITAIQVFSQRSRSGSKSLFNMNLLGFFSYPVWNSSQSRSHLWFKKDCMKALLNYSMVRRNKKSMWYRASFSAKQQHEAGTL